MNVFILEDKWIEQRYLEQTLRKIQTELKISKRQIARNKLNDLLT